MDKKIKLSPYNPTQWEDGVTDVNAKNLNNEEDGVYNLDITIEELQQEIGDLTQLLTQNKNSLVEALNEISLLIPPKESPVIWMDIKKPPTKINYAIGGSLDLSGLEVTVTSLNNKTKDIPFSEFNDRQIETIPANNSILNGSNTDVNIIYTWTDVNVSQAINVREDTLSALEIKTPPTKIAYFIGDVLDLTGLVITLVYESGIRKDVQLDDFANNGITTTPINGSILNTVIASIKISKGGLFVNQGITVVPVSISGIVIKTNPTKINYYTGDVLNLDGLVVTLSYNNGTTKDVSLNDFASNNITTNPVNGSVLNTAGQKVTITAGGFNVVCNINVIVLILVSILIKTPPTKTVYNAGELLDLSGTVLTFRYANSTTKEVPFVDFASNGVTTVPANGDQLTLNNTSVVISKDRTSVTQNIVVNDVSLSSLVIKTPPTKTSYFVGESLNLSGLVVTLSYSNGTKKDVPFADFATENIITNPVNGAILSLDNTSVTISKDGKKIIQTLTINEKVSYSDIYVKIEPTKLIYIAGENLNLTGLIVTLKKTDGSTEEVPFSDFASMGITTVPVNGSILNLDNKDITISIGLNSVKQVVFVNTSKILFLNEWTSISSPEDNSWQAICYGNALFVAVASSGTNRIMTSPDGINWTARKSPEDNEWISVCYGNGLFVAVSGSGTNRIMTSPDGITWTARKSPEDNYWRSVCYGNGLFVAVAYSGTNQIMTSPDGITWTVRKAPGASDWTSICYGNGLFVAVADYGTNRIMTSPDGINWTARKAPEDNTWYSVCYGNGLFVAVAYSGTNRIMTSPDGIIWTKRISPNNTWLYSVCYGNGLFVAVAYFINGQRIITSYDGINWKAMDAPENNNWQGVYYGNNTFVAVASSGTNRIMISEIISLESHLGEISEIKSPSDSSWQSICYGNNLWVAVAGSYPNQLMTSSDGENWTLRMVSNLGNKSFSSVCYGNGVFVAVISYSSSFLTKIATSSDGINWTLRKTPNIINSWTSACYGNGLFVVVGRRKTDYYNEKQIMTSPDGITWTLRQDVAGYNQWDFVTYCGNMFIALGTGNYLLSGEGTGMMTSLDGITWVKKDIPNMGGWKSVCYGNGIFVAVASDDPNIKNDYPMMTSYDGIIWTERKIEKYYFYSIIYSDNLFFTIGMYYVGGVLKVAILTSLDGINWFPTLINTDSTWKTICYGNGLFVSVADRGTNRIMLSQKK